MSALSPEPDLQVAARLLAEGRPSDAAERLGALVAELPVYAAAHVLHATALEADGRPTEALDAWGRAAVLVPSSPLVHRERRRLRELARTAETATPDDGTEEAAPQGETATSAPPAPAPAPPESYDMRPVDERFLRDDEPDQAEPSADDDVTAPSAEATPAPPPDPFFGDAEDLALQSEPDDADEEPPGAELLPPETASVPGIAVTPETPGGSGWTVLDEDEDALDPEEESDMEDEDDVVSTQPPSEHPVADELDSLISRLQDAPRIRPDPGFSGPSVSFDNNDVEEMASETLAKIYEAQGQFGQAATVYETLASRQPAEADRFLELAAALRGRRR